MSEEYQPDEGYQTPEQVPYIPYASFPQQPPLSSPAGADEPALPPGTPLSRPEAVAPQNLPAPGKSRRRLWITISVIFILLLASLASFFVMGYLNRSTPVKTLDAFCNALQHEDYRTAYSQFSKKLQGNFSETSFATILSGDKVTACTHGSPSDSGTSVTTSLKLVHASKGINNDMVTLTKDGNNEWKIDDVSLQG